jgi:hypothetical protein
MEPIKKLRKHHVREVLYTTSLWDELSRLPCMDRRGQVSWIIVSSEVANMINSMYEVDEIEVSDLRIEDDTYVQDIFLKPKRTVDNINLNITVDKWQSF